LITNLNFDGSADPTVAQHRVIASPALKA